MAIPVIERLIGIEGCPIVTTENVDEFLALDGMVVLFFTGDPRQRPESNDVAVVLREMSSVFPGQFRIGIVDQAVGRGAETPLRRAGRPDPGLPAPRQVHRPDPPYPGLAGLHRQDARLSRRFA